jgi:sigma-B regulation protein RsbU (phosphoserine phosphatase)
MMQPATQVGGDFYDAMALDRDRLAIAVGDVSGKGIPAALFMVRVVTLLRTNLLANAVPEVMPTVNRMACQNNDDMMFATMFLGVFNVRTGLLQYVNGGHNPPFLSRRGRPFGLLQVSDDILVGVDEEADFTVDEVTMAPGDALLLYTDGVTEAENATREFLQEERVLAALNRLGGHDAAAMVRTVRETVASFAAGHPPSDDITMLALRYAGVGTAPTAG